MSSTVLFSLEGRGLKLDTAADLEPHIKALKENEDVEEVRLQGNTLGVGACEALAAVLRSKKKLRTAVLADIFTSRLLSEIPPALDALLTALLRCPQLRTVDLSDNAFGLNTVAPLQPFLLQHTPLQHLILTNNGLGPAAGTLIAEALTALAAKKESARSSSSAPKDIPDLETVICGRNRLESGSMAAWAKAYQANKNILTIKMTSNGIRQEGVSHLLSAGLAHCASLHTLDLQDNTFTHTAAGVLAATLPSWPRLKELGVGDCLLTSQGMRAVAKTFSSGSSPALEILRLQYNEIDISGLKALVDALHAKPKLRRVELNGNKFNEDPVIERLKEVLDERREEYGPGFEEGVDEEWGLDELDDLEEEDEDEDEDEGSEDGRKEEPETVEEKANKVLQEAEEAEDENVALEEDKSVDQLANMMEKAELN
ncbi:hypothetical protein LTR04_006586 [Oleoguttula sp. CCFEE 6159]|nr:hypothetical protein LTR04_006586 [Oleoguttula sp. CCFEE 6159]